MIHLIVCIDKIITKQKKLYIYKTEVRYTKLAFVLQSLGLQLYFRTPRPLTLSVGLDSSKICHLSL